MQRSADGRVGLIGVETCSSVWACPVCSRRITAKRAEEVAKFASWAKKHAGLLYMLTLTVRHDSGLALQTVLDGLREAWRDWWSGGSAALLRRQQWGLRHYVCARETTHGAHGWHPHKHVLCFADRLPSATELRQAGEQWQAHVKRRLGERGEPTLAVGLRLTTHPASQYPLKLGLEIARIDSKRGRGPSRNSWQIAGDAADGDPDAIQLWQEYVAATKGCRQLTWSRGTKRLVGITDKTDEQLASERQTSLEKLNIPPLAWDALVRARQLPLIIALATRSLGLLLAWLRRHYPREHYHLLE